MSKLHWEDFTPGRQFVHGPLRIDRAEMIAFAAEFDPQPMHLDEMAARGTMLDGLAASGWYGCCILMRMIAESFALNSTSMGAPGIDEVRWLKPIRAGDELTFHATVLEVRASRSRPDMGLVRFDYDLTNAAGVKVLSLTSSMMMGRRTPGTAAP